MLDSGNRRGRSQYSSHRMMPFSPMNKVPLAPQSPSMLSGFLGLLPPSCQYSVQAGLSPRAGNSNFSTDFCGAMSSVTGDDSTTSTLVGLFNASAQLAP